MFFFSLLSVTILKRGTVSIDIYLFISLLSLDYCSIFIFVSPQLQIESASRVMDAGVLTVVVCTN